MDSAISGHRPESKVGVAGREKGRWLVKVDVGSLGWGAAGFLRTRRGTKSGVGGNVCGQNLYRTVIKLRTWQNLPVSTGDGEK